MAQRWSRPSTPPTWTRTARLIAEHAALRETIGGAPSHWACYRFAVKLREHDDLLTTCIDRVLATLRTAHPQMGQTVAIDGSDLPAYANGQKYVSRGGALRKRFSDPDASWGHRSSISTRSGGGYYGYKVHAAVCTTTGLPLAWQVETAKDSEIPLVPVLVDIMHARDFMPGILVLDRGYDTQKVYQEIEGRGIRPVIPLRKTPAVKAGKHKPPSCAHGEWAFAGSDAKRGASKWRCPRGVPARVGVGQGFPAAHPHSPGHRSMEGSLPPAGNRGARVRQVEARMGHALAASATHPARQAPR